MDNLPQLELQPNARVSLNPRKSKKLQASLPKLGTNLDGWCLPSLKKMARLEVTQ
jgi:hypothetical protein